MDVAYPELDITPYLNAEGRASINDIKDDCTDELQTKYSGKSMADFTTEDVLARPEWGARVDQQKLGGTIPQDPVLLYHSNGDEILPVRVSVALRSAWCGGGANVTFWQTNTGQHFTTAALMSPSVTGWVADRLAGRAVTSNC
jgi:Secretory lipase